MRMIEKLFANTIYLKIFPNRFELKHIESGRLQMEVSSDPFTTERLLVGKFSTAEYVLKRGMKRLHENRWLAPSPIIVVHPMEKAENGLSEVEERALRELAIGAGARKVFVWVGNVLSDEEVIEKAARSTYMGR